MHTPFPDLDLSLLTREAVVASLGSDFLLIDNLDCASLASEMAPPFVDYPMKLTHNIAVLCLGGELAFRINLQPYRLGPCDVLLMQQGTIGEFLSASADVRLACLVLSGELAQGVAPVDRALSLRSELTHHPLLHLESGQMEECMVLYRLMKRKALELDNPFRRGALQGFVMVMANNAFHYGLGKRSPQATDGGRNVAGGERAQQVCARFMTLVEEHHRRERGVAFYAERLCLTPKYLSQVVRQVSGRFASEWIADYVLLEAKALLRTGLTAQQVSQQLHFATQSHLGKWFRQRTGLSPSQYAKGGC